MAQKYWWGHGYLGVWKQDRTLPRCSSRSVPRRQNHVKERTTAPSTLHTVLTLCHLTVCCKKNQKKNPTQWSLWDFSMSSLIYVGTTALAGLSCDVHPCPHSPCGRVNAHPEKPFTLTFTLQIWEGNQLLNVQCHSIIYTARGFGIYNTVWTNSRI